MSDLSVSEENMDAQKEHVFLFLNWLFEFDRKAISQFVVAQRYRIKTGDIGLLDEKKIADLQVGWDSGVLLPYKDSVSALAINAGDSVAQ
jgi:hypothetical protein